MPYPFRCGADLLAIGREHRLSIAGIVMANEKARRREDDVRAGSPASGP